MGVGVGTSSCSCSCSNSAASGIPSSSTSTSTIGAEHRNPRRELEALIPVHRSRERYEGEGERFRELHLYQGAWCNRTCDFCNVSGSPSGWYAPFSEEVLAAALRWVAPDGNLKVYGGEPTLEVDDLLAAMGRLRAGGFSGWFTVFSNGVLAGRVIALLEADAGTEVVLNASILTGNGAPPLPLPALAALADTARRRPGVLFRSHPDLVPVGRGELSDLVHPDARPQFGGACPRCHPVLTTRGDLRACPFAVEYERAHYRLGDAATGTAEARERFREFLRWVGEELEPAASAAGEHPCRVCTRWGIVNESPRHPCE